MNFYFYSFLIVKPLSNNISFIYLIDVDNMIIENITYNTLNIFYNIEGNIVIKNLYMNNCS